MTDVGVFVIDQPVHRADRHRLAGIVTVDGVPASKLVAVILRASYVLLALRWSDPFTGAWEVAGLPEYPEGSLLVLAMDNSGTYNAEAADYVSQGQGIFFN